MNDTSDFDSLKESVYVQLAGETRMLLGRWIYFEDDQNPFAKINLRAHMGSKRVPEGGLSVQIAYAVDVFVCDGTKKVEGNDVPNWIIKMQTAPGDWDSEMLAESAKIGRDPVYEMFQHDPNARSEIFKRAPELAAFFEKSKLRSEVPKPMMTSGKETSKWL